MASVSLSLKLLGILHLNPLKAPNLPLRPVLDQGTKSSLPEERVSWLSGREAHR